MNRRRASFLTLCALAYVFLMAGWWLSNRSPRKFPPVKLQLESFRGAQPDFSAQLEQSLKSAPGVELAPGGAVLSGSVEGTATVRVSAQLRDPATGGQLWSKQYEASPSEPKPIPREVAEDAVKAARQRLRERR